MKALKAGKHIPLETRSSGYQRREVKELYDFAVEDEPPRDAVQNRRWDSGFIGEGTSKAAG